MKEAGIREARQNFSVLIEEVRKGREIIITDRGKPVARLVAPRPRATPFAGRSAFRSRVSQLSTSLSSAVLDDRAERRHHGTNIVFATAGDYTESILERIPDRYNNSVVTISSWQMVRKDFTDLIVNRPAVYLLDIYDHGL